MSEVILTFATDLTIDKNEEICTDTFRDGYPVSLSI